VVSTGGTVKGGSGSSPLVGGAALVVLRRAALLAGATELVDRVDREVVEVEPKLEAADERALAGTWPPARTGGGWGGPVPSPDGRSTG